MDRILIVDDNPKNIQLLGNILSELDYEIEYAQDGLEAVETVALDDFDLILMDVMMPEMDGYEACKRIKKMKHKADIPLIFITAKTDVDSVTHGFDCGGVDYISKPFNSAELLSRVGTHISLKKSKDELGNMNSWLEQKVKERTKELSKANEELAVLDNAKSEFLSIISHEIRTPLNGILGLVDLLKDMHIEGFEIELIEALDESCIRLESFSYNALEISNLQSNVGQPLSKTDVNIEIISDKLINDQKEIIDEKGIRFITSISDCIFKGNEHYLTKGLSVLIGNAIKHSPENAKIYISGKHVDNKYIVTIKDEGNGFPDMIIKSGIKPFKSDRHIDKNPGLDLYLCKLIVEAHNGSIKIANDNGGIVQIRIPVS